MRSPDLVARMNGQLREAFAGPIPRGTAVALAGFPDSSDCGRHAAWLGTKMLLAELGANLVYECSAQGYNRDEMAAKLGSGTILVQDGEGFGARLGEDFPGNTILVMAKQAPPNATFMLGARPRAAEPLYEVVWIGRTDQESASDQTEAAARLSSQAAEKFELPSFDDGLEMHFAVKQRPPTVLLTDWSSIFCENVQNRNALRELGFDARSRVYVSRALYMLSLGHVAVTDRLHAHLLCLLQGIPHILLNNKSGTNWNFHQNWTQRSPLARFAATPADAWSLARGALPKIKELQSPDTWSWQDL